MKKKTGFWYWLVKGIGWGVFTSLVILILLIFSPYLPTKKYLSSYVITSGSMDPTIPAGSLVFLIPVRGDINEGDIVSFISPLDAEKLIVHRLVGEKDMNNELYYMTKGDNNNAVDAWLLPANSVQGKYIFDIPYLGYAGSFIRTKTGFGILVGIPLLYFVYLQVRKIREGFLEEISKRAKNAGGKPGNILGIIGILGLSLTVLTGTTGGARALYSSQAALSGITFAASNVIVPCTNDDGDNESDNPCHKNLNGTIFYSKKDHVASFAILSNAKFKHIRYEFTYKTKLEDQGVIGETDMSLAKRFDSGPIVLGTCTSGNICTYDEDVHDFVLEGEVIFIDGSSGSFHIEKH